MKKNIFHIMCVGFISMFGCEETLPLRNDPLNVFIGYSEVNYIYTQQQNGIYFIITLINNYDETISGKAFIEGNLEIEWIVPREKIGSFIPSRTVKLSTENIYKAKNYNKVTGNLVIDPHDTIKFGYVWDFKFGDGTDIRNVNYYGIGAKNIGCGNTVIVNGTAIPKNRNVYKSQSFRVNCTIKLFERAGLVTIPEKIVSSCAINFWPDVVCNGMVRPDTYKPVCDLLP